jgi:hypothetical protein
MKDAPREELKSARPNASTSKMVDYCLEQLFNDKEHNLTENIVKGLTFEEVIGVLLVMQDMLKSYYAGGINE